VPTAKPNAAMAAAPAMLAAAASMPRMTTILDADAVAGLLRAGDLRALTEALDNMPTTTATAAAGASSSPSADLDVNGRVDRFGNALVHIAALKNHKPMMKAVLKRGANINAQNVT
jgi:hypothetical protein